MSTSPTTTTQPPIDLLGWVAENRDQLKPPLGNKYLYAHAVDDLNAEFLIIGKVKPGVANYLGTTAERLIHSVNTDIVSVP